MSTTTSELQAGLRVRLPASAATTAAVVGSAARTPRQLCRHCNRYRTVRPDGRFRAHPAVPRAEQPWSRHCSGSGTSAPSQPPEPPQADPYRAMRLAYLNLLFSLIERGKPDIDTDLFDRVERTLRALEAA